MLARKLTVLAALAGILAVPAAADAAMPPRGSTQAKLVQCSTGATDADRYATFRGIMRAKTFAPQTMRMRFRLQAWSDGRWVAVSAPNLGVWQRSSAVTIYRFSQTVGSLHAGTAYRAAIDFRWRRRGRETGTTRVTPACRQPGDALPDLTVERGPVWLSSTPGTLDYTVIVRNTGLAPAGPFAIAFTVNGATQTGTLTGMAPLSTRRVRFQAPRCDAGSTVIAAVDSAAAVAESREDNNLATAICTR